MLHNLIAQTDWNKCESLMQFLSDLINHLEFDRRTDKSKNIEKTFIGGLVSNRLSLYNYLFSLEYIQAHYNLKQHDKSLEQLSPGEKGSLLLVFYLVLDKEDIPLIIDQPEDNLDNNSVATILVDFIKMAKKNRQIIMVTHNPNLAVVADSEQVIRVNIDKTNGNKFSFLTGGIENIEINNAIVDILEGTMPAFTKRKEKYDIR
ncbi:MAG: AAA family ATPase [Burkholderiales bacterium]|nr:AAA family ATPase [Burkholderiales bacterium]